jgi:hypothetical protein
VSARQTMSNKPGRCTCFLWASRRCNACATLRGRADRLFNPKAMTGTISEASCVTDLLHMGAGGGIFGLKRRGGRGIPPRSKFSIFFPASYIFITKYPPPSSPSTCIPARPYPRLPISRPHLPSLVSDTLFYIIALDVPGLATQLYLRARSMIGRLCCGSRFLGWSDGLGRRLMSAPLFF